MHAHLVTMRGSWWYVPFVLEDCGRPGVRALAFLAELEKLNPSSQVSPGIRVAPKTVIINDYKLRPIYNLSGLKSRSKWRRRLRGIPYTRTA